MVLVVGCGKSETVVVKTPEGSVSASADGSTVTFEGDKGQKMTSTTEGDKTTVKVDGPEGSGTVQTGAGISEADLGVPVYPGSKERPASSMKASTSTGDIASGVFESDASVAQVTEFYKGRIPGATVTTSSASGDETAAVTGKMSDGRNVNVLINRPKAGPTEITVQSIRTKG